MKLLYNLILALIVSANLQAQNQIQIKLHQPPPNKLGVGDMWNLELNNTTDKEIKIFLTGTATEEKDGLIIEGKSKVFTLKPGRSTYKYNDFSSAEVKYNNGKYKEIILRTGNAPDGSYTICVTAFDESGTEVGRENCIMQSVQQMGSITLLTPGEGEEIDPEQPIMFTWTPLPSGGPYTLRIVEIKGSESKEEGIRANRPIIDKEKISISSYQLGSTDPKLEAGKRYAWQVTSGDVISYVGSYVIGNINSMKTSVCCDSWNDDFFKIQYIINNTPQEYLINDGGVQQIYAQNLPVSIKPRSAVPYSCNRFGCPLKLVWNIIDNSTGNIVASGNFMPVNFTPPDNSKYKVNITVKCGNRVCSQISFVFSALPSPLCQWIQKPDLQGLQASYFMETFTAENKIYVRSYDKLFEYDPISGVTARKNNVPGNGRSSGYFRDRSSNIYRFGGGEIREIGPWRMPTWYGLSEMWKYTPVSDSWIRKSDITFNTGYFFINLSRPPATFSIDLNIGYCIDNNRNVWKYDPVIDTWNMSGSFPGTSEFVESVSVEKDNLLFYGLGSDLSNPINEFWKFNPFTNTWTRLADYPGVKTIGCVAFALSNKIYIGLGSDNVWFNTPNYSNELYQYDIQANTWSRICDFPNTVNCSTGRIAKYVTVNNKGYLILSNCGNNSVANEVWEFTP